MPKVKSALATELAKDCRTIEDIQEKLKELFKDTIRQVFEDGALPNQIRLGCVFLSRTYYKGIKLFLLLVIILCNILQTASIPYNGNLTNGRCI